MFWQVNKHAFQSTRFLIYLSVVGWLTHFIWPSGTIDYGMALTNVALLLLCHIYFVLYRYGWIQR